MSEDLDPSEFVQRIRQLGEQRDQQDAERVRKLEEEIIQGRSERLARRAGLRTPFPPTHYHCYSLSLFADYNHHQNVPDLSLPTNQTRRNPSVL